MGDTVYGCGNADAYPNVIVEEVYEEEEHVIRKPKKEVVAPVSTPVEVV